MAKILFLLIGSIFVGSQMIHQLEDVSGERHVKGDFGSIDLVSVCKITEENVSCWDEKGKRHKASEEKLKTALANDSQQIPIKYGQKNPNRIFRH